MEDSGEVDVTPKKVKKTRSDSESGGDVKKTRSESESGGDPLENKSNVEPEKVIHNGTGNSSREDISEENIVKEKAKAIKITKISKSSKTTPVKDNTKNVTASPSKKTTESPAKTPAVVVASSSSPSSSALSEDFCGFQDLIGSNEQLRKKEAFNRFLSSLEDVGDKEGESEGEGEPQAMTVEDAEAADSDSNQMEIDEGNSRADSAEFSDKNGKARTRDSDVDVMETDSVKSGGDASVKTEEEEAVKAAEETAEAPESEPQPKVEYCGTCGAVVDDAEEGICCDGKCERWFHLKCSGLTQAEYDELGRDENAKWACSRCSGKPPPVIKPGAKPLLTVRKDLTAISTPSPKRKMGSKEEKRPRVDISNPIFLKPFDYGWKRELVYRSTTDSQNKKQGDVYYYTPKGKKLRSLREISEHLLGTDLTVDNFTFWKDALGCDPEKEIIRDAKIKLANKDSTPSPAAKKLGTPKTPKTPKLTPKLTATVTPLDSASGLPVAKASASVTPRVVLKTGKTGSISTGPKFKVTPSKTTVTPGQAQKIVISKDEENTSKDDQLSRNINGSKNERSSRNEVRCSAKEKSQVTKDNIRTRNNEIEKEGGDVEIIPKNKFRRYGLLANRISTRNIARKRRSKSSSSSSSSSSEDLITTPESEVKASLMSKLDCVKAAGLRPLENDQTQSERGTCNVGLPPLSSPMYNGTTNSPLPPDTIILPSPNMKRPRSPEIQFRPSDPSSYGCQTSAIPPCRPIGPGISSPFRHPFETVLIVDTSPTEAPLNPPKRRTALQKSPSPVQWTQDCSIQVFSVETLRSREFSNEGYLVASPSRQSGLPPKKQSTFFRAVEGSRPGQSVAKTVDECSPRSIGSSSTDVVVIEEDSSPPFLIRNSPPPKLGRNVVSPNRSPPSLQANLPPPPLLACPPAVITINSAGNSITSLASSEETLESNETGSQYEGYRKFKRERFYERRKAKQEMERLKLSYQKERKLFIKRKSQEKRLQIDYLRLKVKIKAMKLSLMKRKGAPE